MSYSGACIEEMAGNRPHSPCDSPLQVIAAEVASMAEAQQPRRLLQGEIHAWHTSLELMKFDRGYGLSLLSENEHARMGRFLFQKDKDNFLFCRAVLRMLLASYLGTDPKALDFTYSAHGKPSLARPSGALKFNLSHSHGHLLIATSLGREIGVDIEYRRHDLDVLAIAERFFSHRENETIRDASDAERHDAFFSCWTRKEAYVKARGEGLSRSLESFDVSVDPRDQVVHLTTRPDPTDADRWTVYSLNGFAGFAAAIAVQMEDKELLAF